MSQDDFSTAIGRTHSLDDVISADRARALWVSLEAGDREPVYGDPLPALWHWLYFWEIAPRSHLAPDGHAELGGFLPPLGDVGRMWAASRVTFHRPLAIGAAARRVTTLTAISRKTGRSGPLTFVTLTHEIATDDGPAITDVQDLVYRPVTEAPRPATPGQPAPTGGVRTEGWTADEVLLFRYSALTFNGHRIHYDAPYAEGEEGFPGPVVHGPLIATLMAGAAGRARPQTPLATFEFRALRPLFAGETFTVHVGAPDEGAAPVWVRGPDRAYRARGSVTWAG